MKRWPPGLKALLRASTATQASLDRVPPLVALDQPDTTSSEFVLLQRLLPLLDQRYPGSKDTNRHVISFLLGMLQHLKTSLSPFYSISEHKLIQEHQHQPQLRTNHSPSSASTSTVQQCSVARIVGAEYVIRLLAVLPRLLRQFFGLYNYTGIGRDLVESALWMRINDMLTFLDEQSVAIFTPTFKYVSVR